MTFSFEVYTIGHHKIGALAMTESWKKIPGFPGYKASSDGRIMGKRGQILSGCINNITKYRVVCIMRGGKPITICIHHLVCSAFHGMRPQGKQVAHADGSRTNNQSENLRWATCKENHVDALRHGTHTSLIVKGERNGHAILTERDVKEIRAHPYEHFKHGRSCAALSRRLAGRYGVSPYTIKSILVRQNWRHVA